ncbi:MAG: RCC1 domain-containing protein, partial [Actinomycetota bacterium]
EADDGQLGYGNPNVVNDPSTVGTVPLGPGRTAEKITAGRFHTCALLDDGNVRCWGEQNAITGQPEDIGENEPASAGPLLTAADFGGGQPIALSAGARATCVLADDDTVWCWGAGKPSCNSTGMCGSAPAVPAEVDLGGRIPVALDLGFDHACVLFSGGGVGCWGVGDDGRLGYGDTDDVGDDEPPLAKGLVDVGAGRTVKAISAGRRGTCALLDNDTIRCWGDASEGVPGGANTIDIGDDEAPGDAPPVNYVGTATFRPLSPFRILETRAGQPGPGPIQGKGIVNPGGQIDVQITGQGGIPTTGVYAVVLNLTLAQAIDRGFVTAFPFGTARPNASNVNVTGPGQTAPNKVIVPVSQDGKISIFTRGGGHLIADVFGYFEATASADAGRLIGVNPARVVDTRPGFDPAGQKGKLGAGGEIEVKVTGANGVPATGVSAVVLNVTGADGDDRGFITVYPGNVARPTTSNINLSGAGATRPNTVIVPVSPSGTIKIFSQKGAHIVVDVTAYFTDATAADTDDGLFARINPARLGDSRDTTSGPLPKGGSITFEVEGKLGIPNTANAGVFNLTATESLNRGFVTGYPSDIPRPDTSNLNLPGPNETIANLAVLPLGDSGDITLFTQNGASLIMDTAGYFL